MEPATFLARALTEGQRYGDDAYVFLRELAQNARDARAAQLRVETSVAAGRERIVVVDDGEGMTLDHAESYLFRLYASSKEQDQEAAGHFGVGFWSVLRWRPDRISIESRPAGRRGAEAQAAGWGVSLGASLSEVAMIPCGLERPGTRVILERPLASETSANGGSAPGDSDARLRERPLASETSADGGSAPGDSGARLRERPLASETSADGGSAPGDADARLRERVRVGLRRYCRYLRRSGRGRRGGGERLPVWLGDERLDEEMSLEGPLVLRFFGRAAEGVVGLGPEPRVELYARGLLVSEASFLEELEPGGAVPTHAQTADGLSPVVLINSDDLDVVLSRRAPVQSRALRRLVRLGQKRVRRLVRHVIDRACPRPWTHRLRDSLERGLRRAGGPGMLAVVGLWVAVLVAVGFLLAGPRASAPTAPPASASLPAGAIPGVSTRRPAKGGLRPVANVAAYRGPTLDTPDGASEPWGLRHDGPDGLLFKSLTLDRFDPQSGWRREAPASRRAYAPVARCAAKGCLTVRLEVRDAEAPLGLPLPTGYRLDPERLKLNGRPLAGRLVSNRHGEALVIPNPGVRLSGTIRYAARQRGEPLGRGQATALEAQLPAELTARIERFRPLRRRGRARAVAGVIRDQIAYDVRPATVAAFANAPGTWLARVWAVGAGDCDVKNGVNVLALRHLGVPARLAVGIPTRHGQALAGLHAWTEYYAGGRWQIVDATGSSANPPAVAGLGLTPLVTGDAAPFPPAPSRPAPGGAASGRGPPTALIGSPARSAAPSASMALGGSSPRDLGPAPAAAPSTSSTSSSIAPAPPGSPPTGAALSPAFATGHASPPGAGSAPASPPNAASPSAPLPREAPAPASPPSAASPSAPLPREAPAPASPPSAAPPSAPLPSAAPASASPPIATTPSRPAGPAAAPVPRPSLAARARAQVEGLPAPLWAILAAALGLALGAGLWRRLRVREVLATDDLPEAAARRREQIALVKILKDALTQPAAWRSVSGLWYRRVLPTLRGRRLSVADAIDRARLGTLWLSRRRSPLAEAAAACGTPVLDAGHPVFGELIRALGRGVDLDELDTLAPVEPGDRAAHPQAQNLVAGTNRILAAAGLDVRCRISPGLREAATRDVDLTGLRLPRRHGWPRRFVAVNPRSSAVARRAGLARDEGALGLFVWVDWLLDRSELLLDVAPQLRKRAAEAALAAPGVVRD